MKTLKQQSGFLSLSIIELVLACGMAVFLLTWVAYPIRTSGSAQNILSYEMQQRQASQLLDPLVEDVRESQLGAIRWDYLDTTNTATYNPVNFPWLWVPSSAVPGTINYVCYYFDTNAKSLQRVLTATPPPNMALCDPNVPGASTLSMASNLAVPTLSEPIFRGDMVNKTVYISLRVITGSTGVGADAVPSTLVVSRVATPRN